MSSSFAVLVTGATGRQGGAVARRLLEKGHRVRAFTRDPRSQAAKALAKLGAELAAGDFDDPSSLVGAARDMDAVFAMSTPFAAGVEAEVRQGIALVDAAKAMRVKHFVYSSVCNANQDTGIPHFESKRRIEQYIRAAGIPYTLVAPAFFMENLLGPASLSGLRQGKLLLPLSSGRPLQLCALADLAAFVVLALEHRERFLGERFDLASDELTGPEMAAILSRTTSRPIDYVQVPPDYLGAVSDELMRMYDWLERVGYQADITGRERAFPQVRWHALAGWAQEQDWHAHGVAAARPSAHPTQV